MSDNPEPEIMNSVHFGLEPGTLLLGRFELESVLGEGATAVVYRARDQELDRLVAIKVLIEETLTGKQCERFQNELRMLSRLDHPGLVKALASGVTETGKPFLVLEYVEGTELTGLIDRNNLLPFERIIEIASDVCDALKYAHDSNVVHRDLKPSNIIIDNEGKPRIIDFGIGKVFDEITPDRRRLTQTNTILGSLPYVSPEQCRGGVVDRRSDIYSLGCVIYQMISGRLPFEKETPALTMHAHLSESPPTLERVSGRAVPPQLKKIVSKMMEKEPADRYDNASLVGEALRSASLFVQPQIRRVPVSFKPVRAVFLFGVTGICIWSLINSKPWTDDETARLTSSSTARYQSARWKLGKGQWRDAARDYKFVVDHGIADHNSMVASLNQVCLAELNGNHIDAALSYSRRAMTIASEKNEPGLPEATHCMSMCARAYVDAGDSEKGLGIYDEILPVLQKSMTDENHFYRDYSYRLQEKADCLVALKRYEEAEKCLREALGAARIYPDVELRFKAALGGVLMRLHRRDEAGSTFNDVLKLVDGRSDIFEKSFALLQYSRYCVEIGEGTRALKAAESACKESDRDDVKSLDVVRNLRIDVLLQAGELHATAQNWRKSGEYLSEALSWIRNEADSRKPLILYYLGIDSLYLGDYAVAEKNLRESLRLWKAPPGTGERDWRLLSARIDLAVSCQLQGKSAEADRAWNDFVSEKRNLGKKLSAESVRLLYVAKRLLEIRGGKSLAEKMAAEISELSKQ